MMENEILIPKEEVDNRDLILSFLKLSTSSHKIINMICDKNIEQIYQQGGRPKAGTKNDPDRFFSEQEHDYAIAHRAMPNILPKEPNKKYPSGTLFEWVLERLCLDLKLTSKASKEDFFAYFIVLDEGANEAEKETEELGGKYGLRPEMAFSTEFFKMSPPEHAYFTSLLNKIVLRSLRIMLSVIYFQWYPEDKKTSKI